MNRVLVLLFLAGCHPVAECSVPDSGTVLQTPCAGMANGTACCLGATPGTCQVNECVAK